MRRLWCGIVVCFLFGFSGMLAAQSAPKNPSGLAFICPDHATDDGHEVDIVRESDGVVIQTLSIGDPVINAQGEVELSLNVQPIAFGSYRFVARAVAGTITSDNSLPSALWERAPGKPSGLVVR